MKMYQKKQKSSVTKLKPSQLNTEVTAPQSLWEGANSLFSPLKTVKNLWRKTGNQGDETQCLVKE